MSAPTLEAGPILGRLADYAERRAQLHADVRAAAAAGVTPAEIVAASGLSRQWVARILATPTE